jgi:rhodanese-related sulfurtransferase
MFAQLMGLKVVSPDGLHQMMQGQPVTVIDVNSPQSWSKARVPGALNLDPVNYADSDLPSDKGASLVFYCSNPLCRKAPNAARRAKKMGYDNVKVMSAGISGWLAKNLPTEAG